MATTVKYKGSTLTTATNQTKILKTAGKYMEDDVTIEDVSSGGAAVVVSEETTPDGGIIKYITAIDLSNDTVSSATLLSGYTAHDFQGNAIVGTYSGGGITPTGTINITSNGIYNVTAYASASVSVAGQTVNNQNKTVSASTVQTTVTYDNGYTGLGTVTINAIPTGTAGTPSATKSAVSNNQITITPSVTNTTGYITGSTKTGTGVTVSANELVSGTKSITSNGSNIDVTNYAKVSVNVPTGSTINNQDKTVTPTTSEQEVTYDTGYTGLGTVTVTAIPSVSTLLGIGGSYSTVSGQRKYTEYPYIQELNGDEGYLGFTAYQRLSGSDVVYNAVASNTTITPTESSQTIGGANYMMEGAVTVAAISSNYVGSNITTRSSADLTVNGATITAPAGYYSASAAKSVAAGTVTAPATITSTGATLTTGTNTLTLSKSVSVTPNVTAAGYISQGTAGNATVTLTASVTTKGAATYTPSSTNQTIASNQYLTGVQTISGDANLLASNIKKDISIFGITGTYEGGGGSTGLEFDTTTATATTTGTLAFTGLKGAPISYNIVYSGTINTSSTPTIAGIVYDGTNTHIQTITNTSNAQVSYASSGLTPTYSSGTLAIGASGMEYATTSNYILVYSYNGSTSDIHTADVQVGSGATSITFTGLEQEPDFFSCIFKSNFSTSSGYQRVIIVAANNGDIYGMEMDSSAKYSNAHWSYSYSNGSLTITSSGTNAGGYFHQPGYYQLTYGNSGSSSTYQQKTVTPTTSQQIITADSGYEALSRVTVNAIPSSYVQPTATKGATTYTPTTTAQTIASGTYLTGTQTIQGDANLVGSNILSGKSIFGVSGTVVFQTYYTGTSTPAAALGSNGDIYLKTS